MKKYITTILFALVATFTFGQQKAKEYDYIHTGMHVQVSVERDSIGKAIAFFIGYKDMRYPNITSVEAIGFFTEDMKVFVATCDKAREEGGRWKTDDGEYTIEKKWNGYIITTKDKGWFRMGSGCLDSIKDEL